MGTSAAEHDEDETTIVVSTGRAALEGTHAVPADAAGVVLFAHGSGSSRHSPRNRMVAAQLRRVGLATLLLDLLSAEEEAIDAGTATLRFDIGLLAGRLAAATDWLAGHEPTRGLPLGYFGASTGAAAALVAAAERPEVVGAVVSRGGRPDLAGEVLGGVVTRWRGCGWRGRWRSSLVPPTCSRSRARLSGSLRWLVAGLLATSAAVPAAEAGG